MYDFVKLSSFWQRKYNYSKASLLYDLWNKYSLSVNNLLISKIKLFSFYFRNRMLCELSQSSGSFLGIDEHFGPDYSTYCTSSEFLIISLWKIKSYLFSRIKDIKNIKKIKMQIWSFLIHLIKKFNRAGHPRQ